MLKEVKFAQMEYLSDEILELAGNAALDNYPETFAIGNQKLRGIEQTFVRCHYCPGWCLAKHSVHFVAKEDR